MTFEANQNPYFVRLYCAPPPWIRHCNYNIVNNKSFDKIKIVWALKFQKKGGTTLKKGGTDPLSPPPYMVIICPNSHEKLTKSKLSKVWSRFEHCSESLVYMKLYLVIICTKSHDKLTKSDI